MELGRNLPRVQMLLVPLIYGAVEKVETSMPKAMTPRGVPVMRWTTEKPKVAGWYWWRENDTAEPECVLTIQSDWEFKAYFIRGRYSLVKHIIGHWSGPLVPPGA